MLTREIKFDEDATKKLLQGAETLAKAVGATLGPRGRNVAFERQYGVSAVVHDGVTVAKQVELEDPFEQVGVNLLREAAEQTNNAAGDGTTTAIVLAHAILTEGHRLIAAKHNPMMLRRGIMKAVDAIDAELVKMAKPIKTDEQKQNIAIISAQDEAIGRAIAAALKKVGDDGVVTVDESGQDLSIDIKEGMQFDRGLMHPLWITDQQRLECVLEKPVILVTDQIIIDVEQIEPMLENIIGQQKQGNVLIIAKDITGSALQYLAANTAGQPINLVPVKAPGIGDEQADYLQDIATLTGAKFISQASGDLLKDIELQDLGSAKRVTVGMNSTIIVDGEGIEEDVKTRIASIDDLFKRPDLDAYQRERLKERKSKLTSGVAIIHVGGRSEADVKERKERVIDAIGATKAAIEQGIVVGGETALLRARRVIKEMKLPIHGSEESFGFDIVFRACEAPFKLLVTHAGEEDAGAILAQVVNSDQGYDVMKRELLDLEAAGIVDPVKVTRNALANAATAATSTLTTGVVITLKREGKQS